LENKDRWDWDSMFMQPGECTQQVFELVKARGKEERPSSLFQTKPVNTCGRSFFEYFELLGVLRRRATDRQDELLHSINSMAMSGMAHSAI